MHNITNNEGKAAFALRNIEGRTAHIVAQIIKVVDVLHSHKKINTMESGAFTLTSLQLPKLTINDLETHINHWKFLLPDDVEVQARLLHLLAEKYPLSEKTSPKILSQIKFQSDSVKHAYKKIYGNAINSIFKLYKPNKKDPRKNSKNKSVESKMRQEIAQELEWVFLRRQDTLFHQGDAGNSLYVVSDGLLRVVRENDDGGETLVAELGRNQIIGEMSIVTGEPRSATIYAVRDSELCRLSKESFERLNKKYHVLMTELAVHITRKFLRNESARLRIEKPTAIAIVPINAAAMKFATQLVNVLKKKSSVLHLSRERIGNYIPEAMAAAIDSDEYEYELSAWLDEQNTHYNIIIYEADLEASRWSDRCIQRADRILLVAYANGQPELSEVETKILANQDPRLLVRQELILLHKDRETLPNGTKDWLSKRRVDHHHHATLSGDKDVERIARFLKGQTTGLVLGGGGTRGVAHAGVMQALEELGIQIDMVGGTSAGSVYGAQMALGSNAQQTFDNINDNIIKKRILLDYTLPLVALSAARRITKEYNKIYGDVNIEDLWMPFFCISANVSKATMTIHRSGNLSHAVRASSSIPGVYPPVLDDDGSLLVDGGVFNNVPIDVMADLNHGGEIIAVDIGHQDTSDNKYHFKNHISGWDVLWNKINPWRKTAVIPSISEMITRVAILTNSSQAETQFRHASVLIRPEVAQFESFDVDNQDAMFKLGYRAAIDTLTGWQRKNN